MRRKTELSLSLQHISDLLLDLHAVKFGIFMLRVFTVVSLLVVIGGAF